MLVHVGGRGARQTGVSSSDAVDHSAPMPLVILGSTQPPARRNLAKLYTAKTILQ